jgi:hypothetical protein
MARSAFRKGCTKDRNHLVLENRKAKGRGCCATDSRYKSSYVASIHSLTLQRTTLGAQGATL